MHNVPPLAGCVAGRLPEDLNCIKEAKCAGHRAEAAAHRALQVSSFNI